VCVCVVCLCGVWPLACWDCGFESWMSVSCKCCVLLGRGLCDGPITRPEKSYPCGASERALEISKMRGGLGPLGLSSHENNRIYKYAG